MTLFSFTRKEEPLLQLYGKLPIAKDYLRVGCGDGVARALREWMDQAFSSRVEGDRSVLLPNAMRFAWFDRSGALLGVLSPSSDAGGLRPFPLALSVERRRRALLTEMQSGLREPLAWWLALERKRSELTAQPDGAALLAAARGASVRSASDGELENEAVALEPWIEALWPERGREGLERALLDLSALARGGATSPVRLPLVWGFPLAAQAHAWWTALEVVRDGRGEPASAFFPAQATLESVPAMVTLFRSTPSPRDQRWLLAPEASAPLGDGDFCSSGRCIRVDSRAEPERIASLADSLRGLLTGLRGRHA